MEIKLTPQTALAIGKQVIETNLNQKALGALQQQVDIYRATPNPTESTVRINCSDAECLIGLIRRLHDLSDGTITF